MDFGKLTSIDAVDFTLPADHPDTARFLAGRVKSAADAADAGDARAEARVLLGCPRWADRGFHGKIYPPKTKQSDQLPEYARSFDTIELNTTFYGVREELIARWRDQAPARFRFCPKIPKAISHHRQLLNAEADMERFVRAVSAFGDRLGPSWILLPPGFPPSQRRTLRAFLDRWSGELALAVELRHEEWFVPENASLLSETFAHFEETGTTAILTDVAGRRDVLHQRLTSGRAIVRFVGNRLHATDYARVDAWSERLASWLDRGLGTVFLWLHQPEEALNVEIAERFAKSFEAHGIATRKPARCDRRVQGELF